jgi:hypothetical protein
VEFFNASISRRREEGATPVSEGRLEDAAAGSRSRAAFGLTRSGRQRVGLVGPEGCLGRILLWRSNRLPKWNGLRKRDSWAARKLWRRIWVVAV